MSSEGKEGHGCSALLAGAQAASTLMGRAGGDAKGEVVHRLSEGLRLQLEAIEAVTAGTDELAEVALLCADLANLAACYGEKAAAHRAAGAARTLAHMASDAAAELEEPRRGYLLRDARNADWRASLAARQEGGV